MELIILKMGKLKYLLGKPGKNMIELQHIPCLLWKIVRKIVSKWEEIVLGNTKEVLPAID